MCDNLQRICPIKPEHVHQHRVGMLHVMTYRDSQTVMRDEKVIPLNQAVAGYNRDIIKHDWSMLRVFRIMPMVL